MNFGRRVQGMFFGPKPVFQALAAKPVWIDVLALLLIVGAVFAYAVAPFAYRDSYKAFKDDTSLQERMGKERFETMIKGMENPTLEMILARNVGLGAVATVLGMILSAAVLLVLGRIVSTEGKFLLVWTALLHVNLIDKVLGSAVRLVLTLTRQSVLQTTTSLALLVPNADFTSPAFIILSQFDLFQLWMFGVLGLGLGVIFKVSAKTGLVLSYVFWLLKSLVLVGIAFAAKGLLG